jgi:hypothetical protein
MSNKETLEEAAKKSFGEIWASLTTEQSEYLKGYIDRQIDMAKRRQAERMYSEEEVLIILDKFLTSMIKGEKTGLLNQWFEQFKKK